MQQRWVCHAIFSLAVIGSLHATARAQAWVPDKGQLGVSLNYNLSKSDKVVTTTTFTYDDSGTTGHQVTLGAEYVPIEKLAVGVSLPFVALKYSGGFVMRADPNNPGMMRKEATFAHPGGGSYDDGSYHTTLTDLRIGARYQLLDDPIALTPHLAVSVPVADYETVGNTVAGRHLKQLHAGLSVGRVLGVASYVHLLYEFTLSEKYDRTAETKKNGQNFSDIGLTLGTKLLDYKLDLHAGVNTRIAHGGLTFAELDPTDVEGGVPRPSSVSNNELLYHDALLKEQMFLVGGGIGYDISSSVSVSLDVRYFVENIKISQNTQNASVLALGLAWTPLN